MRISLIIYSLCLLPTLVLAQIDLQDITPTKPSATDIKGLNDDPIGDLVSEVLSKESATETIHSFEQYNNPQHETTEDADQNYETLQTGEASWYGKRFHGRKTASGKIYDMHDLTAAHRTLPLGTHVRVTNLRNNKSVIVQINDRGPYAKGRIIDLSYAAAKELDFISRGHTRVKIERIAD